MWDEKQIQKYLKENLKYRRYEHSLSVSDTAEKLASIYGADVDKAKLSGLIHDCAKNMNSGELIKIVNNHKIPIDEVSKISPDLLHGRVSAIIAEELMGINDEDILNAVIYHTTGRKSMSLLEKIIYLADYIEPLRNFPEVDTIRNMAYIDLDKALIMAFDSTIRFVLERGQLLHLATIESRNFLILQNCR